MATSAENWLKLEVGQAFVRAHQSEVIGVLRGHGLIAKVPNTHRYAVTGKGRRIVIALLTARQQVPRNSRQWRVKSLRRRRKLFRKLKSLGF